MIPSISFHCHPPVCFLRSNPASLLKPRKATIPAPSKTPKQGNASHVTLSRFGHPATPPSSPTEPPRTAAMTSGQFNQLLDVLKQLVPGKSGSNKTSPSAGPFVEGNTQPAEGKTLASKLEFKTVDEVYVVSSIATASLTFYLAVGIRLLPSIRSWRQRR
jgi:hypothetical protein